jgi:transcriptional regulator GlxA family with amidase domain
MGTFADGLERSLFSSAVKALAANYLREKNMKTRVSRIVAAGLCMSLAACLAVFAWQSAAASGAGRQAGQPGPRFSKPKMDDKIRVAFVLTEGAQMIDFAGPWETFQDVMLIPPGKTMKDMKTPFELYTVSGSRNPIHTTGGMTVVPDYTFDDAPTPRIVIVGAQMGDPNLADWLRRMDKQSEVVMSVCTGAFQLGDAGLLDGKKATTHHDAFDRFQQTFPKVTLVKGQRFVQSDDVIYTSGGLTSGIDLALHIVEKFYGRQVAMDTAKFMEYESTRWME